MAIPRRGLQDIRTLTGKVVGKSMHPYKAYLRISHIEMEKARKTRESEASRQLMANIATRLQEIEAEKDALLQTMGERGGAQPPPVQTGPRRSTGVFRLKY